MKKKVSILIPCYNVEAYLPTCLDSITNQTYRDLQIVIVEDGSKDNTLAVAQKYAEKDERIEVYHQENKGVAYARNTLLSKIKGDLCLFVDGDDWIEPDMVEFLVKKVTEENADIATCGNVVNDNAIPSDYKEFAMNQEQVIEHFLYHNELRGMLWNKLFSSSLLEGISFQEDISYGEDALFCWNVMQRMSRMAFTTKALYHYRMNQNGISLGKFGPKKLSGHKVWTRICEDVASTWPQFLNIAQARFCIETTLLLRNAAFSDYKEEKEIKMMQNTIKQHWHCLNKVNITTLKMKLYSFLACRCYWLAGKI